MQSTQTLPHVVPFPQSVRASEPISQLELDALLNLRGRLKQLQETVASAEEALKARLEAGAQIQLGDHTAQLKESFRRNVAWKDVAIRLADRLKLDGEIYCARVLASTKPTKSVSLEIH